MAIDDRVESGKKCESRDGFRLHIAGVRSSEGQRERQIDIEESAVQKWKRKTEMYERSTILDEMDEVKE